MKPLISILVVNYNSSDFINLSLYALFHLTKNPYVVFIMDNSSEKNDFKKLKQYVSRYKNVYLERRKTSEKGSEAHGSALNELIKKVNTQYFVILDADCTWLKKNWDDILISKIKGQIKVIGTQAPIGKEKPQDFPLMFAALFETKAFVNLKIDFRPKDVKRHFDTGFEMREKYLKKGYLGKIINMKNTRDYKEGPFKNILCAEYYLSGINKIFASHFGRGSSHGISKYINKKSSWIYQIPLIGYFFARIKGEMEKRIWLKICRDLVENQV